MFDLFLVKWVSLSRTGSPPITEPTPNSTEAFMPLGKVHRVDLQLLEGDRLFRVPHEAWSVASSIEGLFLPLF